MTDFYAVPPLLPVPVVAKLLHLAQGSAYRLIRGALPRAAIPGRWRIATTAVEALIGRKIEEAEYLRAVAAAKANPTTREGPVTEYGTMK
jgi:hypothetical protein